MFVILACSFQPPVSLPPIFLSLLSTPFLKNCIIILIAIALIDRTCWRISVKTRPTTLPGLERIFSISYEIVANPSQTDILHTIVEVAADLAGCEKAGILLSDSASNMLNFVAAPEQADRLRDIPVPIDHSIAGSAFITNRPVIVYDVEHDPRYYRDVDQQMDFPIPHSILAVPLTFREHKIGVLQVVNKKHGRFTQADIDLLVALAAQATITIEISRLYRQAQAEIAERTRAEDELRRHKDHLEELVRERTAEMRRLETTDQLTGLCNYGSLMRLGFRSMQQARENQQPFAVFMLDIDRFKKINDTYGHSAGDEVLYTIAGILRATSRAADIIGRYSGEAFAVLMPGACLHTATQQANHVLSEIRQAQLDSPAGPIRFTASIGVVEMDQDRPQTFEAVIDMADQAMMTAKQAGRDQVFVGSLLAEVQRNALTDALTGLYVRGYWTVLGNQAMQEAQRCGQPFSAILLDGDHFKDINDTYGHPTGDEVARRIAAILREHVRASDIIGRYGGGDEYLVLMPNTTLAAACHLAERLLHEIRAARIAAPQGEFGFTASLGVAEMDRAGGQTLDELIAQADQALYAAKQAGRDRVVARG